MSFQSLSLTDPPLSAFDRLSPSPESNMSALSSSTSYSSTSSSTTSSSADSSLIVAAVDLSVVWLLLAGFVLCCLLLSAVGGVKWRRHKRLDELTYNQKAAHSSGADDAADSDAVDARKGSLLQSTASEQLSSFSQQLHSQHASTVSLLAEQQLSVRSQLDRLCAEAEQLKALLAARLSGDRGFVDAAIALLLSDITASESYRRRQAKREEDVLRQHSECMELLDDAVRALAGQTGSNTSSASDTQSTMVRVKEAAESLIRCVSSAQREADKERARVRHSSSSSSSILGNEAVALLTRHTDDEAEAEHAVARLLHTARAAADNFLFACLEHDMEANGASAVTSKGGSSGSATHTVYIHRLQLTCRRLHSEVARSVGAWPAAAASIAECRAARSDDETEALQCLERQKQQVDSEAKKGLFAGLNQQLVDSITLLIQQTAAQQQLKGQSAGGWRGGVQSSGAANAASTSGNPSDLSTSLLSTLLHSAYNTAASDGQSSVSPFHAAGGLTSPSSLSSSSLGASFSAWRESDAVLSGLLSADSARKLAVCGELDRLAVHAGVSAADATQLRDAAAAITSLHSQHSAAAVRVEERSRAEEQRAIEQRLAALRDKERQAERQREALQADFDATMASRASAEADRGGDSDAAAVARLQADFDAAMELIQSALQQETLAAQTELSAIHQQHRTRLAAQQSDLRRQQQQQMAEAVRQYEQTHKALTDIADEKCHRDLQLEGIDVPNMRSVTQAALSTPSARETALVSFHQSNIDELNRRHQADKRLMEEDMEQQHRDAMQAVRAEWEEEKDRQRAVDEEALEERVRAAADSTTAAALRSQHADETKKRERRWQEEWSMREASGQQQHKAAVDVRRQQLAAEQASERAAELGDQREEMFQVRIAACKRQEAELLDHSLHDGTRADAKRLIESAMASRHAAERARLMAQQESDSKQHIARLLEADMARLSDRRQRVQADLEAGRLTEADAASELAAIDSDSSPASTSQRVFALVAESAAASLSTLHSRQWEETKAAMLRAFPDETFSGSGWRQQAALNVDVQALAEQQSAAMQSAIEASREQMLAIEREEQAAVQRCREEQQQRMEQLDVKLAREEDAIRAQFDQQLAEAQAEHEAKLAQLSDDLQRVAAQQPVDERAVAEYEAAIEDEKQSHALLMQQAAEQFEAEVAIRSEAQRVHMRSSQQQQLNEAIKQARTDRQQQEKDAFAEQSRAAEELKADTRRAMALIERQGRVHRAKTQRGVKHALQAMVARLTASASQQQQPTAGQLTVTSAADVAFQPQPTAAQLDRIEALMRQLTPDSVAAQQQTLSSPQLSQQSPDSSASAAPSLSLHSAIPASSLTARQRALVGSVHRMQASVCAALAIRPLELRLTSSALTPASQHPSLPLPLSHLYTLCPTESVLLLHDDARTPPSHHCVAAAFLSAGRHSQLTQPLHSATYQTSLVVALTAAIGSTHATQQHLQADERSANDSTNEARPVDEERLDELTEQLCALLPPSSSSADSSRLQSVIAAIEAAEQQSSD